MTTRSPILFLVFNRPDTTRRVFEAIRAARPVRLYVAADGPRPARTGEAERCDLVRQIATQVDWPCEVKTLMRTENLGCKRAVSSAINWFFDQEPEGIVLEDDCLPDHSFFSYCDELLERYRSDPKVMCISGDNFISKVWQPTESYYFSGYMHIWGWATWRRAWQHYDVDMAEWPTNGERLLKERFPSEPRARARWKGLFHGVAAGQIDTWDYQWMFACWNQGGLSCMPRTNLISNIGFGQDATHTVSAESKLANISSGSVTLPLVHPSAISVSAEADKWTSRNVLDIDESQSNWTRWYAALVGRFRSLQRS